MHLVCVCCIWIHTTVTLSDVVMPSYNFLIKLYSCCCVANIHCLFCFVTCRMGNLSPPVYSGNASYDYKITHNNQTNTICIWLSDGGKGLRLDEYNLLIVNTQIDKWNILVYYRSGGRRRRPQYRLMGYSLTNTESLKNETQSDLMSNDSTILSKCNITNRAREFISSLHYSSIIN